MKKYLLKSFLLVLFLFCNVLAQNESDSERILLNEDFQEFPVRMFSTFVKAFAEYHYVAEAAPKFGWVVSAQGESVGEQRAWWIYQEDGKKMMVQTHLNEDNWTHPVVISGDSLWTDYTVKVSFKPESDERQSGILFRYQNDRCYYFFGIEKNKAILKMVNHATAFHKPLEKILAQTEYILPGDRFISLEVKVQSNQITAYIDGVKLLQAFDATYSAGKIGLMSDLPAKYSTVLVTTSKKTFDDITAKQQLRKNEELALQKNNPQMKLWKKIKTPGFGAGRNLRFGDLDNDGETDVVIGQIISYGPKGDNNELSCLTAMTFDGKKLWQIGKPDLFKYFQTTDVPFQINDIDNDDKNEIVYCKDRKLIVAEGATGKTKYSIDTPIAENKEGQIENILGDCIFFCDVSGKGYASDLLLKDRYNHFWVYNNKLELLWKAEANTGHFPYAVDLDNDGKDELAIGYSLFDDDGKELWTIKGLQQHADGIAVLNFNPEQHNEPQIMYASSDEGYFRTNLKGDIIMRHFIGHVQNPSVANFRDDLPGLETVSINFHGNQGIITYFDSEGNIYKQFEPVQHGSMMLPLNWTGKGEEYFVLSPDVEDGGAYDGWGRKVLAFPGDGHPYLCNAVLDICGDVRDEIVVWDPYEIWVYTQSDNPKPGKLYKPVKNPYYNNSNYQATVSLPGWTK
jgi:rhamnogalacturonan endolyase